MPELEHPLLLLVLHSSHHVLFFSCLLLLLFSIVELREKWSIPSIPIFVNIFLTKYPSILLAAWSLPKHLNLWPLLRLCWCGARGSLAPGLDPGLLLSVSLLLTILTLPVPSPHHPRPAFGNTLGWLIGRWHFRARFYGHRTLFLLVSSVRLPSKKMMLTGVSLWSVPVVNTKKSVPPVLFFLLFACLFFFSVNLSQMELCLFFKKYNSTSCNSIYHLKDQPRNNMPCFKRRERIIWVMIVYITVTYWKVLSHNN